MKKILIIFLTLLVLCGCSKKPPIEANDHLYLYYDYADEYSIYEIRMYHIRETGDYQVTSKYTHLGIGEDYPSYNEGIFSKELVAEIIKEAGDSIQEAYEYDERGERHLKEGYEMKIEKYLDDGTVEFYVCDTSDYIKNKLHFLFR